MARILSLLMLFPLVVGCSDARPAATPSPSESPSPTPTDASSPGPTPSPSDGPGLDTARALVGSFSGTWRNTTLGSVGPVRLEAALDEGARELAVTFDFDGAFFGGADTPAEEVPFTIGEVALEADVTTAALGPVEAAITDAGLVVLTLDDVPGDQVDSMSARGTADEDGFALSYTLELSNGTTTDGTIDVERVV